MDIDVAALLEGSDVMLIFTALGLGLLVGKLRLGSFELGSTPGVLLAAMLLGSWGLDLNAQTESLGFMLFIFCVGIDAGPNFFSNFVQDGAQTWGGCMQRCRQSQEISRLARATVFCREQLCGRRLGQSVQGWRAVRRDARRPRLVRW